MLVNIPDVPSFAPQMGGNMDQVALAKMILKEHKAERKKKSEEEKKKEAKLKPRTFNRLETTGLLLLFAIPVAVLQQIVITLSAHQLINLVNQLQNVPHP